MSTKRYRLVFCGSATISQKIGACLAQMPWCHLVGVITQPDKAKLRNGQYRFNPVKQWALTEKIVLYQPERIATMLDQFEQMSIDALITCAYGQIIPRAFLQIVRNQAYNFHASWLPFYRGGAPVQRCLWDGAVMSGMSLMLMEPTLDTGPVFVQLPYLLKRTDTTTTVLEALATLGCTIVRSYLPFVLEQKIVAVSQNHDQATYAPNVSNQETWINWDNSWSQIDCQIRALADEPGALTSCANVIYKIYQARWLRPLTATEQSLPNGTILGIEQKCWAVKTSDAVGGLIVMQKAGKKKGLAISYHLTVRATVSFSNEISYNNFLWK